MAGAIAAVFVGGMLGTSARVAIDALLPHGDTEFPLSTLLINVIGSFVLGALVTGLWPIVPTWVRAGLGTGILGSFTTFSALAVAVTTVTVGGNLGLAALDLVLTLLLGFTAAALGLMLGQRAHGRRGDSESTIEVTE
jgi:CrcB protein